MSREFNISIRVAEVGGTSFTEVKHEGCPLDHIITMPFIGPVVEQHLLLDEQKITRLEITL